MTLRVLRAGSGALLVECPTLEAARAVRVEAERRRAAGEFAAVDLVGGASTLLIDGIDPDAADALAAEVPQWPLPDAAVASGPLVELPVVFDGPDLEAVAAHWQSTPSEVVQSVTSASLEVAFCGFAPGFAYLSGLGREVPRREQPRTAVPAGAVGLAGPFAGVYPRRSPGGWQIVGTLAGNAPRLWDAGRDQPALLAPGTRVRFVRAAP